jgi:hypothetical protein
VVISAASVGGLTVCNTFQLKVGLDGPSTPTVIVEVGATTNIENEDFTVYLAGAVDYVADTTVRIYIDGVITPMTTGAVADISTISGYAIII